MNRLRSIIDSCLSSHISDSGIPYVTINSELCRKDYKEVEAIINASGGIYQTGARRHNFLPNENPMSLIKATLDISEQTGKLNPYEFYPTPDDLADSLMSLMDIPDFSRDNGDVIRLIEPHAGRGSLVKAIIRALPNTILHVISIERDVRHLDALQAIEINGEHTIINSTFEDALPTLRSIGPIDGIIMNPPFSDWARQMELAEDLMKTSSSKTQWAGIAAILPPLNILMGQTNTSKGRYTRNLVAKAIASGCYEENDSREFSASRSRVSRTDINSTTLHIRTEPFTKEEVSHATDTVGLVIQNDQDMNNEIRKAAINARTMSAFETWLSTQRPKAIQMGCPWIEEINISDLSDYLWPEDITQPGRASQTTHTSNHLLKPATTQQQLALL